MASKALTFWPQRVVSDDDAQDLLDLFREVQASGKHLALMAHYNHWQELETDIAREAVRRVRATGAVIRAQGPLLAHINDNADDRCSTSIACATGSDRVTACASTRCTR